MEYMVAGMAENDGPRPSMPDASFAGRLGTISDCLICAVPWPLSRNIVIFFAFFRLRETLADRTYHISSGFARIGNVC